MTDHLPKAILLDLDDTIIQAHGAQGDAWRQVLQTFAGHDAIDDHDHLHDHVVTAARAYWADPEQHRIGRHDIRQARRDANDLLKQAEKDKDISEDDLKRGLDNIQSLTNDKVKEVDGIVAKKESEILEG